MQLWAATGLSAQVAEILDGRSGFLADACLRLCDFALVITLQW